MAIRCRIWWDVQTGSYILTLVPDKNLKTVVALLKSSIPSGDRDYDPKTNFWYMKEQYGEAVRGFVGAVYGIGSVSFTSKTVVEQAQQQAPLTLPSTPIQQVVNEFVALVGDKDASFSYVSAKKAYRKASLAFHPDHGGDPSKMARLNELWSRLKGEFYKR